MTTTASIQAIEAGALLNAEQIETRIEQLKHGKLDATGLSQLITALSAPPEDVVDKEVGAILEEILGDEETRAWRENVKSVRNGHGDPIAALSSEI